MIKTIFFAIICLVFLFPQTILAVESIKSFDSQIIAHQDGSFDVVETIEYDFGQDFRHGIFRDIPRSLKLDENTYRIIKVQFGDVKRNGESEKSEVSQNGDTISVKIGDPDETITGSHTYKITYRVQNGIGNFSDHDEIYWNVTGNGWSVPISSASASLSADFDTTLTKTTCYTGYYGESLQECSHSIEGKTANFAAANPLQGAEGLSIVVGFPANTFPKSTLSDRPSNALSNFQLFLLGLGLFLYYVALPAFILYWYLKQKRRNRFGKVAVNFDIPKDSHGKVLPPAEAGATDNATLEKNDVIATIFDLAIRKFIKIEQTKEKKGIWSDGEYTIKKLSSDTSKLNPLEKSLFDFLFKDGKTEVKVGEISKDFYTTFSVMRKQLFEELIRKNLYTKDPMMQKGLLATGGTFSLFTGNVLLSMMLFYLSHVLNGRTAAGDEVDWKVDGLKLFLKNMKREYTWQAQNVYTVEKYIPYAMALGYIDEFMKQFKEIYPDYQPTWYSGRNFYNFYPGFYSGMNSSFVTNAPSSSSGFGGGGFSGGGGGGGGGGSW